MEGVGWFTSMIARGGFPWFKRNESSWRRDASVDILGLWVVDQYVGHDPRRTYAIQEKRTRSVSLFKSLNELRHSLA